MIWHSLRAVRCPIVELFRKIYHTKFVILTPRWCTAEVQGRKPVEKALSGSPSKFLSWMAKDEKVSQIVVVFGGEGGGGLIGGMLILEVR